MRGHLPIFGNKNPDVHFGKKSIKKEKYHFHFRFEFDLNYNFHALLADFEVFDNFDSFDSLKGL